SACRQKIHDLKLDGYLVTSRGDQYYLTHFNGEDGAALILPRTVWLVTDGRFQDEAAAHAPWAKDRVRRGSLVDAVKGLVKRQRISRLGFQPENMTVELYEKLRKAVHPIKLVPAPGVVQSQRLRRDDTEVAAIQRAARVAEDAFRHVTARIRI